MDWVDFAAAFAWAKTGKRIAARIAIMAMTTRSSISVNANLYCVFIFYARSSCSAGGRTSRVLSSLTVAAQWRIFTALSPYLVVSR